MIALQNIGSFWGRNRGGPDQSPEPAEIAAARPSGWKLNSVIFKGKVKHSSLLEQVINHGDELPADTLTSACDISSSQLETFWKVCRSIV